MLRASADALDEASSDYGEAPSHITYAAFAGLVRISAFLVEWQLEVLAAGADADRFLRAAKERVKEWLNKYLSDSRLAGFCEVAAAMEIVSHLSGVKEICLKLARVPMPVGLFHVARRERGIWGRGDKPDAPEKPGLAVAFVEFTVGGVPVSEVHHIAPNMLHDVDITVRVSRWPERAERLVLKHVSVENPAIYELPNFTFRTPKGAGPFNLHESGRVLLKIPQSIRAKPLEFRYMAEFEPLDVEQPVEVVGQRTLRLEGVDWQRESQTGYANIDRKILEIRNQLRRLPGVPEVDMVNALKVAVTLGKMAGQSVQDNIFPGQWLEKGFHNEVRRFLRSEPSIGAQLQEHPRSAGGITDLSYEGIPIELKAEKDRTLQFSECSQFLGQTVSYAVGNGRRLGILCVLDTSPRTTAPLPVEDGVGIQFYTNGGHQVPVITLLVQGNLLLPSSLSKG